MSSASFGCKHFALKHPNSVAPWQGRAQLNALAFGSARTGCSAPKPRLAGLQHSGGGHCRTCLTDRLHQDRFHRLCEPSTAQIVDLSQTEDHGKRSLPQAYLSTGGFHSCFTWRHALLQAVRTFEQCTNKEKAKHGEGHMSLTKVGNSSSPS